jgi:gliding motility-associated-like protein
MYSEDSFIFPVGNDGVFQSARIRRIDASSPVDFSFNVIPFGNYDIEKGITKIHESFYWNVVGSQPAYLSLSWNALSAIDALTNNNLENLIIAGYDGNSWRYIESKVDLNTYFDNSPSSLLEGSITSVNPINLEGYTAFTLATRDSAGLRLNISQGFTPNGDGINDTWFIENIESFPNAQITVISRWGRIVFESPGQYQNDWNGVYQDNLEPLPDGSYAYTIDLEGDGKLDLHGWIYITR